MAARPTFPALTAPVLASLLMIGAVTVFSGAHGIVRFMSSELHPFQNAFLRSVFGLLVIAPILMRQGGLGELRDIRRPGLHLLRGATSAFATIIWFWALAVMPLGEAVALNFTAPIFTTILAAIVLHETVRVRRWTATAVGFIGVLIVLRPGAETIQLGALLALGSAVIISCNIMMIRVLSQVDGTRAIVASFSFFLTVFTFIPAAFVWQWPSATMWACGFAVGFMTTFAHLMLTRAMRLAEASAIIPLEFLRLPVSALIGFLWFAETPDIWTAVGAVIIGAAAVYIARREAIVARQRRAAGDPH